jgi:hypothetical protein
LVLEQFGHVDLEALSARERARGDENAISWAGYGWEHCVTDERGGWEASAVGEISEPRSRSPDRPLYGDR